MSAVFSDTTSDAQPDRFSSRIAALRLSPSGCPSNRVSGAIVTPRHDTSPDVRATRVPVTARCRPDSLVRASRLDHDETCVGSRDPQADARRDVFGSGPAHSGAARGNQGATPEGACQRQPGKIVWDLLGNEAHGRGGNCRGIGACQRKCSPGRCSAHRALATLSRSP